MSAITAFELSKTYGDYVALYNFNIDVPRGSIYGIVGSENSGKTTVLRLMGGLCEPNSGECKLLGHSPGNESAKVHSITGIVTDSARQYKNVCVADNLYFYASLFGIDRNDAIDRASFLLHKLDIWEVRNKKIGELTTSSLIRANLARALMHAPKILLMDEPVFGMNRETADAVKEMINYIVENEDATAVLFTRHLDHAEEICQLYTIMEKGSVVASGTLKSLRKMSGLKSMAVLKLIGDGVPPEGFDLNSEGNWERHINSDDEMPEIIKKAVQSGCGISEAKIVKPSLRDIYNSYLSRSQMGEGEEYEAEFYEQEEQ